MEAEEEGRLAASRSGCGMRACARGGGGTSDWRTATGETTRSRGKEGECSRTDERHQHTNSGNPANCEQNDNNNNNTTTTTNRCAEVFHGETGEFQEKENLTINRKIKDGFSAKARSQAAG